MEMTWEQLKVLATAERLSAEVLERQLGRGRDGELYLRMARASVRDGKLTEALHYYDQAEMLGEDEAHAERRLVALHVGDFPLREDGSFA